MDDITKREPTRSFGPRTSTRATTGAAICRCSAPWASISRSASTIAACSATASPAPSRRWRPPISARCCCSTTTTSATSPRPRSANGPATSFRAGRCCIRGQRSDPVGLRLGRRPSQALFAVAPAGELQGRPRRPARHRRSGVRTDEAPRRGDGLDPQGRGRRKDADRRRHHRAADDVRAGKGRAEGQGRPAGHARARARSNRPTRSRCSTAPPRWSTAPIT